MEKLYSRINFENAPSKKTPLSEENLNKMDSAINAIDNRVIETHDELKSDLSNLSGEVANVEEINAKLYFKKEVTKRIVVETNAYINPSNGYNSGFDVDVSKYCRTTYTVFDEPTAITLPSDEYEFIVWVYEAIDYSTGLYTPSGAWVTNQQLLVFNNGTNYFRICVRRCDGATLTTDEVDETSDVYKIKNLLRFNVMYNQNEGVIDPDMFEGTDSEKITKAMEAVGDRNNGVILINRMYSLDKHIYISHSGTSDTRLSFVGNGSNCGFNLNNRYFLAKSGVGSCGECHFSNLLFTSADRHFTSANLIRMSFENCTFVGGKSVVRAEKFLQSWHFHNCTIRKNTRIVFYGSNEEGCEFLDLQIHQCLIEECVNVLHAYAIKGCTISQCCIEGNAGYVANIMNDCRSFNVLNNYFEANNDGFYLPEGVTAGNGEAFIFENMASKSAQITISGNRFVSSVEGIELIILPKHDQSAGRIVIENNHTSPTAILVKAKMDDIYRHVSLRGNAMATYSNPAILLDAEKGLLNNIVDLKSGDNLNNLVEAGVYHSFDASGITNAPISEGEFFMIHLRMLNTFSQIAITSNGIKSRLGSGEWN